MAFSSPAEAAYIYRGPCGNEVPARLAYPLTPIGAADDSVTILDVPVASLRTGEFAISTHADGSETREVFFTVCGSIPEGQ